MKATQEFVHKDLVLKKKKLFSFLIATTEPTAKMWIFEFIVQIFQFLFANSKIEELKGEIQEKNLMVEQLDHENQKCKESLTKLRKDYENCKHLLQKLQTNLLMQNQQIDIFEKRINFLEKENIKLKDEASKYQLALGNATNFRFSDDDQNNPMHLKSDIENLQNMIEEYVTNLKNGIEINFENVNKLLLEYGSRTKIITHTPNRQLIKAILQQHVLKEILSYVDTSHEGLELDIIQKADDLIELIKRFSYERVGADDITRVAPIKLRQQIYAILGYRGYANVDENKFENTQHPFLFIYQRKLNDTMNNYRVLNDSKKRNMVEEKAEKLIQEAIRIFKFRFKVQEPIIEFAWMNCGTKIMKECVETRYEDFTNGIVDICSFPLIGRDLTNRAKRKIITLAKVIPISTG
ncbi:13932_t:CDS:1 [Dentiscutata erythropus]|uniref:13932_t:CDS:1 n=1 Tax=Dentiscutata erythropus TaxID=1348616 RepID=A0A9N9I0J2_9GLOM|nr:13932_t:CDS:1 [Dentiscutata erythropus]